jgi:hypothetical protein
MTTITQEQADKIAAYLETHELPKGIGTEESACSIAAINLALTGRLTDTIHDCMSVVIGRWIIPIQDAMPHEMRNSREWKRLLPLAAGTGREMEKQRLAVVMDWLWTVVLPQLQPLADNRGFGEAWKRMTTEKTREAAAAAAAAYAGTDAYAASDAASDAAAYAAAYAAASAANAADAAVSVSVSYAVVDVDVAVAYAAASADASADAGTARKTFWLNVNPAACLARMIEVTE